MKEILVVDKFVLLSVTLDILVSGILKNKRKKYINEKLNRPIDTTTHEENRKKKKTLHCENANDICVKGKMYITDLRYKKNVLKIRVYNY